MRAILIPMMVMFPAITVVPITGSLKQMKLEIQYGKNALVEPVTTMPIPFSKLLMEVSSQQVFPNQMMAMYRAIMGGLIYGPKT